MKNLLAFFLLTIPFLSFSQNPPNCDSLTIDCCVIYNDNSDSIELNVANSFFSMELFSYPGFILLDENGDTIGMEQINYFGIGSQGQNHYLEIMNPFTLPFSGTLELYSNFYDSLHCVFPIMIEDNTSSIQEGNADYFIQVHPFYNNGIIDLKHDIYPQDLNYFIKVYRYDGAFILNEKLGLGQNQLPSQYLQQNYIYIIEAYDQTGNIVAIKNLIK